MGVEPLAGRFGPAPALRWLVPPRLGSLRTHFDGVPSTACGFNGHLVGCWGPRPGDASASGWRRRGSGCRPVGYPRWAASPLGSGPILRLLALPASLQGVHGLLATLGWALLHREVICIRPMTPEGAFPAPTAFAQVRPQRGCHSRSSRSAAWLTRFQTCYPAPRSSTRFRGRAVTLRLGLPASDVGSGRGRPCLSVYP